MVASDGCVVSGDKVWKYYGFRLLGGRTFDATGNAANAMAAVTDRTGTIYLLKVCHWPICQHHVNNSRIHSVVSNRNKTTHLSQKTRAMLRVVEYFAHSASLRIIRNYTLD